MYKFKGCGCSVTFTKPCGSSVYCNACLEARVTHVEKRLVSVLTSNYETPELSRVDIENNLKAVAQNWSRK